MSAEAVVRANSTCLEPPQAAEMRSARRFADVLGW